MLTTFRLKQREVKSVQDFIDGETLAEARRGDSSDLRCAKCECKIETEDTQ